MTVQISTLRRSVVNIITLHDRAKPGPSLFKVSTHFETCVVQLGSVPRESTTLIRVENVLRIDSTKFTRPCFCPEGGLRFKGKVHTSSGTYKGSNNIDWTACHDLSISPHSLPLFRVHAESPGLTSLQ